MHQNGRLLETEDKVYLTLLIKEQKWHIMGKKLLDTATKTWLDAVKTASKK